MHHTAVSVVQYNLHNIIIPIKNMFRIIILAFCALSVVFATSPEGKQWLEKNSENSDVVVLPSGLQYKVLQSGAAGGLTPLVNSPCENIC
jgi:hypothetical protein